MSAETPGPTFRDPAGSLAFEDDRVVRSIHPAAHQQVLDFVTSGFYQQLVAAGDMVSSTIDDTPTGLRLLHPRIQIPTYPWEWTPHQWLAAADLTLTLCQRALAEGWILKDATPLNILFVGHRPVLVDVLSFEPHQPGNSTWLAYGQYVRTFLLPLIAHRLLAWPLTLSLFKRDGYEPADIYAALTWRKRFSSLAFWPITLPALIEKKSGTETPPKPTNPKDPGLALHILTKTLESLRKRTRAAVPAPTASEWASYGATRSHYTPAESADKLYWVRTALTSTNPARVLDIGANTGEFTCLAASFGAQVTALERDTPAADRIFLRACEEAAAANGSISTILADLSRPTPAAGWNNSETLALIPRLEGQFDMVLMLAVIHHLILMEQIPIPAILDLAHRLTTRHLVIEWVPPTDPMYQSLMRGRVDLYGSLSDDDLLRAAQGRFQLVRYLRLDNGRTLYLFEKILSL